jgi:hypothetical protein
LRLINCRTPLRNGPGKADPLLTLKLPTLMAAVKCIPVVQVYLQYLIARLGPVIPRKQNSTVGNDELNWCLDKYCHLVENVFARLKHFRAIATRYDKQKRNFESVIALACQFFC